MRKWNEFFPIENIAYVKLIINYNVASYIYNSLQKLIESLFEEIFRQNSFFVAKLFRSYNKALKASAALYTCIRLVCFSSDRLPFPRRLTGT